MKSPRTFLGNEVGSFEEKSRNNPILPGSNSLFKQHRKKLLSVLAGGLMVGCSGGDTDDSPENNAEYLGRSQKMAVTVPLTSVPTYAPFEVDGKMGYGWIYFQHPISGYAPGPYINPFQANSYNPRSVLSSLGSTEWIIVRASFTYDADKNNDGVTDTAWTPINASMYMLVHRSVLEKGEKILFSPRAAMLSESILSRSGGIISTDTIDNVTREGGADDYNNDGVINYKDLSTTKQGSLNARNKAMPGFYAYMGSVYINDGEKRGNALKTLEKMENHLVTDIVTNPLNHDPVLRIRSLGSGTILYTLDGSSPNPGGPTTIDGGSTVTIPLQGKTVYYRERILYGAGPVLGRVKSFDLRNDWMELSQSLQTYNPNGKENIEETQHSYNTKSYTIRAISNKTSPGYTYPKFLDCQVGTNAKDGCHLGPYIAYHEIHESKVRDMIHAAAQAHINQLVSGTPPVTPSPTNPSPSSSPTPTNPPPSHYQNQITTYSGKVSYLSGWYEVQNKWNLTGTKDFPVTIIGTYATPNGIRQPNINATAQNEAERLTFSQSMVGKIRAIIEATASSLPKPTYSQNYIIPSSPVAYRGYTYTLVTTMNTTGLSDFPATVKVKYTTPTGAKETLTIATKDATELAKVQAERISEAKSQIDMALGQDKYAPYFVETVTPERPYYIGSFRTTFTYSGITGKDYPGYIDVYYRRYNGTTGKWTMEATSEAQKKLLIVQGEDQAKLEIDNFPLSFPNQIINYGNQPYGTKGGSYTRYEKYNRLGNGYNFPALIWYEYRATRSSPLLDTRNTYGVTEAKSSEHINQLAGTLEAWVKGQMVALGPTHPSTPIVAKNTLRSIFDLIPSAHAATTSSIVSKNSATKLTSLSPYSPDISYLRAYNYGNPVQQFYMKSGVSAPTGKSKANTVGSTAEEAIDKIKLKEAEENYILVHAELVSRVKEIRETSKPFTTNCIGGSCTGVGSTSGVSGYTYSDLFPSPNSTVQPSTSIGIRIGEYLYGATASSKVKQVIDELLTKYQKNFLIMYAIIIEEQSHLIPGEDYFPNADSFGLSQIMANPTENDVINFGYKIQKKSDLIDPIQHLSIMNERLEQIKVVLKKEGIPLTTENIGRIWNGGYNCKIAGDLCPNKAINYGKRIKDYTDNLLKYYNLYTKK